LNTPPLGELQVCKILGILQKPKIPAWHMCKMDSENFKSSFLHSGRNKGIPFGFFMNSSQASNYIALDWPPIKINGQTHHMEGKRESQRKAKRRTSYKNQRKARVSPFLW